MKPQLICDARVSGTHRRDVDSPVGPVRSLLPPVTVTGRVAAMGAIPAVGQHTDAIRAEFAPTSTDPVKDQS